MRYVIDRFEGNRVVLIGETGKTCDVPREKIDAACKEGDAVVLGNKGIYEKDSAETDERKRRIEKKMECLWE